MENKRKAQRVFCQVPVESKVGDIFENLNTLDFSRGGFGFVSENAIPVGKEIVIEIDLQEDGTPVFVIGQVRWVEPIADSSKFRIGLSFESVFHGSRARLNNYFKVKSQ